MNLRMLLLVNLLLQAIDGIVTHYSISVGAYEANPLVASAMEAWGVTFGLWYYKVLATVLLLLIYALRRRGETLAIRGLSITAAVYLCFHLVAVGQLLISP